jgi:fibronectin type 3 domain-containing protein
MDPAAIAPPVPGQVSTWSGSSSTKLSWPVSPGATSYRINRSLTSGAGYATIADGVVANNYLDTSGLADGTTYFYTVQAEGAAVSAATAEVFAIPHGSLAMSIPLTFADTSSSTTVSWPVVAGAASYVVYQATASGGPYSTYFTANTTALFATLSGNTYYYLVAADSGTGPGIPCPEVTHTVP